MDAFVDYAPESWEHLAGDVAAGRPPAASCRWACRSGRTSGPTWLVTGDAGGAINPFNGEGIAYAYETGPHGGRGASTRRSHRADGLALRTYERRCRPTYDLYYKVARAFVKIIGRPELMRVLVGTGMRFTTRSKARRRIRRKLVSGPRFSRNPGTSALPTNWAAT